jgi:hypothetical protein
VSRYGVTIIAALLAACSSDAAMRRYMPADADARSRSYLALLTRGQVDSATSRLPPRLVGPRTHDALARMAALLGGRQFDSTRVIGVSVNTINGVRHVNVSYELHSPPNLWSVANVTTFDSAQTWFVEGATANAIAHPLEDDVRFTLAGKTFRHYLWLLLSFLSVATSLGMAVFIGTRRGMPKRYGWAALSLVCLGMFSINWTTGASVTNLYSVQIGGASLVRGASVVPWVLSFSIPIGAYYAWRRYRQWQTEMSKSAEVVQAPEPAREEAT